MAECNSILSAYTLYRHLGWCCTKPSICNTEYKCEQTDWNNNDNSLSISIMCARKQYQSKNLQDEGTESWTLIRPLANTYG